MVVHLTPEQENLLSQMAARAGKVPEQVVQDALTRALEDEAEFTEAVLKGFASLDAGRFIEHEEIGARIERMFS
jgi:predicted transcriptional regulator